MTPFAGWRRLMQRSLGARIVGLFLGLLLVVQVASFTAIRASLWNQAHRELPEQLALGDRVLQSLIEQQAQRLLGGAEVVAADYAFREAVSTNDPETIASVLANHGKRIQATDAALFNTDFSLRAATGNLQHDTAPLVARLALRAMADPRRTSARASEVALIRGKPYQVVMVPVRAPVIVGWVLMAFPLDARLLENMRSLSAANLRLTLLTRGEAGTPWRVQQSQLAPAQAALLAQRPWTAPPPEAAAPVATGATTRATATATATTMEAVDSGGEQLGVHPRWLSQRGVSATVSSADSSSAPTGLGLGNGNGNGNGSQAEAATGVLALTSISIDDAVRLPYFLQVALLSITLLGITGFAVGSVLTARRVTTPLRRLTEAAARLGAGDFDTPMRGLRREDEIGRLSQAFENMRINVANQRHEILKLAYWDTLTGLPNRVQFRDAVRDAIAESEGKVQVEGGAAVGGGPATVIMLDLDRFKHVNDVLGYRFGDLLLARVAERLTQHGVRGGDLVARLGGDEFAVLLKGGDAALGASVAQRIERAFDEPLTLEEHKVDMGAGIGIACYPQHAADADSLLSRAEVAMYAAKRRSSGALLYDPSIDAASSETLSLLTELRQAVGSGELRLYLQPKLALDTARVVGAEALVRWQHPERGLVPPMSFIPFAEQTGFIRVLTQWIFEEAARHWLALHAEGIQLTVSVNLSTRDLLDPDLPKKFDDLLQKHRVPAEGFCLEITESAIMDDPQRALATLERLSAAGFALSIDDFGTGYSSLAYLKKLPVDELKIDQSFVKSMERDEDDRKIVRSTIDLAHNMGLTVVAEGVENAHTWNMLRDLNCDQAQGYHMGRPMPADDFASWSAGWLAKQLPLNPATALTLH